MSVGQNVFIRKIISFYLFLSSRARYVLVLDFLALCFSVYIAYSLRLTFFIRYGYVEEMFITMAVFSACVTGSLLTGGAYRILWNMASIEEYTSLLKCYLAGCFVFLLLLYFAKISKIPRSSLALMLLLGICFLTVERAFWKLFSVSRKTDRLHSKRALIVGAGEAGTLLARDIMRNPCDIEPVGFLDDKPELKGMTVSSIKVLGPLSKLRETIVSENIELVLIAIPSASGDRIKRIMTEMEGMKVKTRIIPSVIEIAGGFVGISRLRSVSLEDLLRREPVTIDAHETDELIMGRRILVTGAGGSIGSEICRQVLAKKPSLLLALGHGEQSIYKLMESVRESFPDAKVKAIIADVADIEAMRAVFEKERPEIVFHAAAHKHVPLMEDNPREALRVNAMGSSILAEAAGMNGTEKFVMISTDKAVNPTSVMGSTKRIAERLIYSLQKKYPDTKYMAVRFGNVLGSRGSVVPKFESQIENGGPVTITHREMKRYFMLISEAVSLVLQAGTMGKGGELFVLDMGEPVNITEMAETLIRLHGHEPYSDIKIEFTGIRPGEKLFEELFYDPAKVDRTGHQKIFQSKNTEEDSDLMPRVEQTLADWAEGNLSEDELKAEIFTLASNGELKDGQAVGKQL